MKHDLFQKCCSQCTHTNESPCNDFIDCLNSGPICHENRQCTELKKNRFESLRKQEEMLPQIILGTATCGIGAGALETREKIDQYLRDKGIDAWVKEVGCIGLCSEEPIMDVCLPGKNRIAFGKVTEDKVTSLLDQVFEQQVAKEQALYQYPSSTGEAWPDVVPFDQHPFFANQKRWALKNCGLIDPTAIDEYLAQGGYQALAKVLKTLKSEDVCDIVEKSGLKGRGGGGFLTGKKWKFALNTSSFQKYFVCNADEGDPGAFMDRALIEGDPHCLLEGLTIASYAIGASKAYIYIRAEYPLAIKRLQKAIRDAREVGVLGYNILDSGFNLDIIIKQGAGAFVCGEETALIHSIEGKRGMPRPRPPFPAVKGLFDKPTIINNVESLANVPGILKNGHEWFSGVGTGSSKGTKVFALSGKIKNSGLIEVAMGTTIREIVESIGGGIPGKHEFKAVQMGGPSGGCIPSQHLDTPIDYESLKSKGAMMGSGGMVVMDESICMVDVAKYFMNFIQRESCGKCIPCREGTKEMLAILERITQGKQSEHTMDSLIRFKGVIHLEELAQVIKETSLCGLGQSAPNPVLSTLRWFKDEYEAHIFERRCPAGECLDLITYVVDNEKCKGCTKCKKGCPNDAIMGSVKTPHYIIPDKCVKCGVCIDACPFDAISKVSAPA